MFIFNINFKPFLIEANSWKDYWYFEVKASVLFPEGGTVASMKYMFIDEVTCIFLPELSAS